MPKVIQPQIGPQTEALASSAEITIIGGSAGGGKSFTLLMDPLPYLLEVPGFHGAIFRRTFPEIALPGGLWDTSFELYKDAGGIPRRGDWKWLFPYDNTISFHHLQHPENVYSWQGSQLTYFGFDELSHFRESMFSYIVFSRGRSGCDIDSYVRGSCNPDPGWLKTFLAPWVDKTYPDRAESGETRHFIRNEKGILEWVDASTPDAKSMAFVRATVYDNKIMLARNPRYISSLKALPPVERARLLDGDWDVRREGLVYPGFDICIVELDGGFPTPGIGGIDFGFHNPFAALWGHVDHDDVLWITGCRYKSQTTLPVHSEALPKGVEWWCDPSGAESIRQLRDAGHDAKPCVHMPTRMASGEVKKPIMSGIDMVSERIRTGRLKIIRETCMPLIRELGLYHYDENKQVEEPVKEDDHTADALRYLIVGLDRRKYVSSTYVPDPDQGAKEQKAEREAKQAEDLRAQADPDDDRWYQ